jgi:hypothetical protein
MSIYHSAAAKRFPHARILCDGQYAAVIKCGPKWIVKLHEDADACEYTVNRCCGLTCVYDHFATKLIIS